MIPAPILVEGRRGFHVVTEATVIDDTKETAASWASEHVRMRPDFGWVLGRFIEANEPNTNGHIFALDEVKKYHPEIVHTPLNMLHRAHHIVGTFTATNLLIPEVTPGALAAAEQVFNPYVEALAAFWRWAFPDEYHYIKKAHDAGMAYYSMEALPETITCAGADYGKAGCGKVFPYRGSQDESYCAHLNQPRSVKRLNRPRFVGGAMIIPPTRPGWRNADISEIAGVLEQEVDEADRVLTEIASAMPHLEPWQWEAAMAQVLAGAYGPVPPPPAKVNVPVELPPGPDDIIEARAFTTEQRRQLTKRGKAMPDGAFPIENEADLKNAIQAYGRAADKDAARRHIVRRARALGLTDLLPDGWAGAEKAALDAPARVVDAWRRHAGKGGFDVDINEATVSSYDVRGGATLWAIADGWGEWYFLQAGDRVEWVAQKMADVRAFASSDKLGLSKDDVKRIGWSDSAWVKELTGRLGEPQPKAAANEEVVPAIAELAQLEAADGAGNSGAIVALVPPPAIAEQLAALGDESPDEMHVTMAYMGSLDGDDLLPAENGTLTFETVAAALAAFTAGAHPLPEAKVQGWGRFAIGEGEEVTWLAVDAVGLTDLRARLVAALRAAGIPIATDHDFTPHMTVKYHPAGDGDDAMPPPLSFPVDGLELWWGGRRERFDLAGGSVPA